MRDKWTDKLPGLLDGYEESVPEGLWDAVREQMRPKRRTGPVFWWAGAAAAAAVAAGVVFFWRPSAIPAPGIASSVPAIATAEPAVCVPVSRIGAATFSDVPESFVEPLETAVEPEAVIEPEIVIEPEAVPEPEVVTESAPVVSVQPEPAAVPEPVIPVPLRKEKSRRRASITFRSGNYLAQGGNIVKTGYGVPSNPGMADYPTKAEGDPVTVQMISRNRESTTTGSHRQGIRLFLGLNYGLSPRWSLESGVSYKVLHSDYNTVSGLSSSTVTRNMTYIGVPVNVQFNAMELGRFSLYLTAGPMVETCTRVRVESRSFVGESLVSEQKDYLAAKDIRLSLNAGVGAQVRLSSRGALFLQPGLSWQLSGSDKIESFYTVYPFAWDLSLGWRFLF